MIQDWTLILVLLFLQAKGYLTTGGTVTADSWYSGLGVGDCPSTALVDGIFATNALVINS
jgi:hypothetical protein